MANEEKILDTLDKIQMELTLLRHDVDVLKERKIVEDRKNETPEERKARQIAALNAFINSTTDEEEPEKTAEFFRIMEAEEARKARIS